MEKIKPIFRWAGSKRKLLKQLTKHFVKRKVFVEPFLGGGSVMLHLLECRDFDYDFYIVNDINVSIIELYKNIQNKPLETSESIEKIVKEYNDLCTLDDKEKMYYKIRNLYNQEKTNHIYFWFLMKCGFNGLYRENKKGEYNVPFGKKEVIIFDSSEVVRQSRILQNVEFCNMDYQKFIVYILNKYKKHDLFVYGDPPYCKSQKYYKETFDNAEAARCFYNSGLLIAVSDTLSKESLHVYQKFKVKFVNKIKRSINQKSNLIVQEILFCNY